MVDILLRHTLMKEVSLLYHYSSSEIRHFQYHGEYVNEYPGSDTSQVPPVGSCQLHSTDTPSLQITVRGDSLTNEILKS